MAGITNTDNTIADKLTDLITAKEDMKSAIEEYGLYGVTVEGGLVTYDDAINNISSKILTSEKETVICEPGLAFQTNIVVPLKVDLRNVTSANYLFTNNRFYTSGDGDPIMETIHIYSSKNVTDMRSMFYSCKKLTALSLFDTSNVTNMGHMFQDCYNLTTIPLLDTSKVTDMSSMFYNCISLTTIPLLDTSKVTNMGYMFRQCNALTTVGGFKNLGMQKSMTSTNMVSFANCANLTHDSLLNILNNLYDRASAGYSNLTLNFNATIFGLLTDEEKAIATNKGWTLAFI